jgi:hypothetical protein
MVLWHIAALMMDPVNTAFTGRLWFLKRQYAEYNVPNPSAFVSCFKISHIS